MPKVLHKSLDLLKQEMNVHLIHSSIYLSDLLLQI